MTPTPETKNEAPRARVMILAPRFIERDGMSFFAGYDQIGGDYFDVFGRKYSFVPLDDHLQALAKAKREGILEGIERAAILAHYYRGAGFGPTIEEQIRALAEELKNERH